jgi:chemotaxis protein histidine kinase CheA
MARSHAAKPRSARSPSRDDNDLVARAEAAMAELSSHFAGWMQDECHRLEGLCRKVEAEPSDANLLDDLFRAAHDVKGEAATFGFPVVARITASLCQLLGAAPDRAQVPFPLVARHVAAVGQALRIDREGEALAGDLERATAQFLRDAMKLYPEIKSPPLAP